MKDNELIRKEGYVNIRWCEKCHCAFPQYDRLDEIKRKNDRPVTRKCCVMRNAGKRMNRLMNKFWPPTRHIDEIYHVPGQEPLSFEQEMESHRIYMRNSEK